MKKANLFAGRRILDLSATLSEDLPGTWPGHFPYVHRNWKDFGDPSLYKTNFFVMDEHCGTHFDAQPHFISGSDAVSGDRVDPVSLCGPAAVADVRYLAGRSGPGESPRIGTEDIRRWEEGNGPLEPGEVVLFLTGWDGYYLPREDGYPYLSGPVRDRKTPGWPAPDRDAILYLADKGILSVGTDAPSIGSVQDGVPVHREGLGKGLHYIEGLCGLDRLPPRGAFFLFLPLKIAGSTGSPGRAVAAVPEDL